MIAADIVDVQHLRDWLLEEGPALGLIVGPKGLPECWAQHPVARHEITGLFLAWSALGQAFVAEPPSDDNPYPTQVVPGPRDFLDLSNASAAAVARAVTVASACARSGDHIAERR